MSVGVLISYFDLFDRKPTMDELVDLLKPIPLRHAIHVLSRINLGLRYAMQELGRSNLAEVQGFFLAAHSDDEMLWRLKTRFPFAMCDEASIPATWPAQCFAACRHALRSQTAHRHIR